MRTSLVSALHAGLVPIHTDIRPVDDKASLTYKRTPQGNLRKLRAEQMDQPAPVVADTLRAFEKEKRVAYPGKILTRLSTRGARLMPRNMILRIAAGSVKDLNQKQK